MNDEATNTNLNAPANGVSTPDTSLSPSNGASAADELGPSAAAPPAEEQTVPPSPTLDERDDSNVTPFPGKRTPDDTSQQPPVAASEAVDYRQKFLNELEDLLTSSKAQPLFRGGLALWNRKSSADPQKGEVSYSLVARLVILSRKLSEANAPPAYYQEAYDAVLMIRNAHDAAAVKEVLDDIEFATSSNSPLRAIMRGIADAWLLTILFGIFVVLLDSRNALTAVDWIALRPLLIAAAAGVAGGTVSIMLRLNEFDGPTPKSRAFLRMTGTSLPLVGSTFAVVVAAIFASGIVPLQITANPTGALGISAGDAALFTYIAIGFMSGFSERFTRGIFGKFEGKFEENAEAAAADAEKSKLQSKAA